MSKFKKGIVFEVTTEIEARIAQRAGACGLILNDPVSDSVKRMPDPQFVKTIADCVALPVIARVRIGHKTEAQIMEVSGANVIEESTQLAVEDDNEVFIEKQGLTVPCICWAKDLMGIVNAIHSGAAGVIIGNNSDKNSDDNAVDIVGNLEDIRDEREEIRNALTKKAALNASDPNNAEDIEKLDEVITEKLGDFKHLKDELIKVCKMKEFPVTIFAHGFKATPADIALMIHHGFDSIILVGDDVFSKNSNPLKYASSLIQAIPNYAKPAVLMDISDDMGRFAY
ncbi:Pyridoxal 5'-phosphate synthase subunit snz1 [Coemansia sp. RSA 1286]|nr:Pyridoxal 5'-phosphate synthase subunit snz1 [Coemansia sp. RSA 1286]